MIHPAAHSPKHVADARRGAAALACSLFLAALASCASTGGNPAREDSPTRVSETVSPARAVNRIRRITMEIPRAGGPGEPGSGENPHTDDLDGYRIAFVSDIHFGNRFSRARLDALFAAIRAEQPDCVIIGGDNTLSSAQIDEFAVAARALSAPEGVYAVLGNHDFWNGRARTIATLRASGIVVLGETLVRTPRGLAIAGTEDFRDSYPATKHLSGIVRPEEFTVLATHDPWFAEYANLQEFDLVLSGHTHGGQIAFFGYAPALAPGAGQRYRTGTTFRKGVPVIVSNGAGYGGEGLLRFRLGAPSDFLVITLRKPSPR